MFCTTCATFNTSSGATCATCGHPLPRDTGPRLQRAFPFVFHRRIGRTLRWTIALLPIVIALMGAGLVGAQYRAERAALSDAYLRAGEAAAAGEFDAAISAYGEAGDYRGAQQRQADLIEQTAPAKADYLLGIQALDTGDDEAAITAFESVLARFPNYEDAESLLAQAKQHRADRLQAEVAESEGNRDWLDAEHALAQLAAIDPTNADTRQHLSWLANTHSPIVFTQHGALYIIGPDMLDQQLVTDEVQVVWPAWSPDRTKIAFFASIDKKVANYGLFVVNPDGTGLTRLATDVRLEGWPNWSPDSNRIVFSSLQDFELEKQQGVSAIHVVDLRTGVETDFTSFLYHESRSPTWSYDGTRVAFISKNIYKRGIAMGRRVEGAIHVVDTRDGAVTDIGGDSFPFAEYLAWSPATDYLLVYSAEIGSAWDESMITTIGLIDMTSGDTNQVTERFEKVAFPVWSPDGKRFAFAASGTSLQIHTIDGGSVWIELPRPIMPLLSWSPDGSELIAPSLSASTPSLIVPIDTSSSRVDLPLQFDFSGDLGGAAAVVVQFSAGAGPKRSILIA